LHFLKSWVGDTPISLDITEKGNPTEHPMFRGLGCPEVHSSDVVQICSNWLLVDGAGIKPRIFYSYKKFIRERNLVSF
jgi:hypothetical protein